MKLNIFHCLFNFCFEALANLGRQGGTLVDFCVTLQAAVSVMLMFVMYALFFAFCSLFWSILMLAYRETISDFFVRSQFSILSSTWPFPQKTYTWLSECCVKLLDFISQVDQLLWLAECSAYAVELM